MKVINFVQEDAGEREKLRNTNRSFIQQREQMSAMAVVSHERDCNIFDCPALTGKQMFCFKPQPDKVVE